MITTAGYEKLADIFTGESSDTITKLSIGYGTAAEALTDAALATAYTDHGFEQATVTGSYASGVLTFANTFTNNDTADRTVREVGLFTAAGVLIYRKLFLTTEVQNFCIVPPGKTIAISASLTFQDTFSYQVGSQYATLAYGISISPACTGTIDPASFTNAAPIWYNGVELPNAGIPKFSEALGAKSWDLTCFTTDYTLVQNILRYAGPLTTENSITGKQYVLSSYRAGVLAIKNMTTHTHDLYSNCYIQGPISPEPFGNGWWFDVKVIQSAYSEA